MQILLRRALRMALVLGLALVATTVAACSDEAVLGDACTGDEDCDPMHRDAICYDDGSGPFCTLACDIEERVCTMLEGTTCVEMEVRYRPDAFAPDTCDVLGGACEMRGERTVCSP